MSLTGDLLKKGWQKTAFVPGPAGGAPAPAPGGMPMDPAMGGMAPAMDPMMAAGGGGMPPMDPAMGGAPVDPAMMGAPPMDPMAGGAPVDPAMMGIPSGPEAAGEDTGETMLPMSEVVELLGAVTGKRAPSPEPKDEPQEDLAATAGQPAAETPAPQSNPITPLGGIDPSALG